MKHPGPRTSRTLVLILVLAGSGLIFATRDLRVGPSGPSSASRLYTDSWGVVIGINEYQHAPKLEYAVADARAIRDALVQSGFKSDHVFELYDQQATKEKILSLLGDFLANPARVKSTDRVVIFYAGHGQTRQLPRGGEMGYLIPVDGQPDDLHSTCISMNEVSETSKLIPARHILWIVDSCYSGIAGIKTRSIPPSNNDAYVAKISAEPAIQIITAGQGNETVIESAQWKHSVFTYNLLNALQGNGDLDSDGVMPTSELYAYLKPRVTRDSDYHQTPQLFNLYGDGEFIFFPEPGGPAPAPAPGVPGPTPAPAPPVQDLATMQQALDQQREKLVTAAIAVGQQRPLGEMATVPAGEFFMGCNPLDQSCSANEYPYHQVYLDAFTIDRFETTNVEYDRCVQAGQCTSRPKFSGFDLSEQPVAGVNWEDARRYCAWAGKRLPTEAEWEKAARGTQGLIFPWGYIFKPDRANSSADDNQKKTAPVGSFPRGVSAYGVFDLSGNVYEWVNDWYAADYFAASPAQNPQGPENGSYKVQKGGAWDGEPNSLRVSMRINSLPNRAGPSDGFRCAK